jgi:hypothetical protein
MLSKSFIYGLCLLALAAVSENGLRAQEVVLDAFDKAGKPIARTSIDSSGTAREVWQTSDQNRQLFFKPSGAWPANAGQTLYLEIVYLDKGYGRLEVMAKDGTDRDVKTDKRIRGMLTDSGE